MENQQDEESKKKDMMSRNKQKELGLSCMLNTEVGAVLAVIRRSPDSQFYHPSDDHIDCSVLQSLKSLRTLIFNPQQEWRSVDPSIYLSPFLDVIQSDDIPAFATGLALSSILKILRLEIFDQKTPGVGEIMNATVTAITGCRLEKTDQVTEDVVMMRILQVLVAVMKHRAYVLLTDHSVCTVVNTCFQVVQQSAGRDLLQRSARHTMQELTQIIYQRLPEIEVVDGQSSDSDIEDTNLELESGFGIHSAVDVFQFFCSLLNVVNDSDGNNFHTHNHIPDLNIQMFALVLINSAMELSGDSMGKHPKLLRMIQDDLFHHLIYYGTSCSPLVLSMICSTVLNIYHFLRRSVRLQLEAFFSLVLFKAANLDKAQIQEVAIEAIVNFLRQPTFTIEVYVNYDCSPYFGNVFEETAKLICKNAFPIGGILTNLQLQSFEGLAMMIHNIADNVDKEDEESSSGPYPVEITNRTPFFWEEKSKDEVGVEKWINSLRIKKVQKKRLVIAGNHFNQDYKKGLEYVELSGLVSASAPPNPKAYAIFFRYTPGLDKTMIGDYFGDPEEFHIQVLQEYTNTFELSDMLLDSALRCFIECFRLPGESQKIQRILEAFSERFYDQQSSDIFENKDAVFVLCYSLIMLNTDQHNPQVKKKMTEEEFIRNNRAINGGKDLPRDYLSKLFHAISSKAFETLGQTGAPDTHMHPYRWVQLVNQSKVMKPYVECDFDRRLGRDMFAAIAGPSIATVAAIFEHSDDEDVIHECVETLFSIARIAQYQLQDTLDEVICVLCKFTTLLNPYASADETLFAFSNDMKPRVATLAVFNIANTFKDSLRGSWRNIIDCLLKLKKLKLLPSSAFDPDASDLPSRDSGRLSRTSTRDSDSGSSSSSSSTSTSKKLQQSGLIGRFPDFVSIESVEESLNLGLSEFEQNMKIIQQCHIERIFRGSCGLPEESLWNLGRYLIFAAGGKGQKFSTLVEEEDTVGFCWDLIATICHANAHRFTSFWRQYHEYVLVVTQFPLFSAIPFAEKAMVAQLKICLKLLSMPHPDKLSEEFIFKSINFMLELEKEILDTCSDLLLHTITKILTEYRGNVQSTRGWKSILHLLYVTGRHPDSYDQGIESLMSLMSDKSAMTRTNYGYCVECAFNFIALKNSSVDRNAKIMDLMCESVKLLVQWYRSEYVDPDSNASVHSTASTSSSGDENSKGMMSSISTFIMNLFLKVGEVLRKTCLARREEVRNHAVQSIQKIFTFAEELCFTPANSVFCFNSLIFAMMDDVHEKMLDYSKRDNYERESLSMENSLKNAMGVMTEVFLQLLKPLSENPHFKAFWMGFLRRMDACVKAEVGDTREMQELVSNLLKKIIDSMKQKDMLVPREGDDLWEITYVQIQWIAPSLKQELFPDLTGLYMDK